MSVTNNYVEAVISGFYKCF